jgi:hypothetical protein
MPERDVGAIAMNLSKTAKERFPAICASTAIGDPSFHFFTPKLRMASALRNCANVDE